MAEPHEELQELREDAEHAGSLAPVSLTMAVLAVLVAVVTLLGHRAHTEEVLLQTKVTDQWAYYQAKSNRRDQYEIFVKQLALFQAKDPAAVAKVQAEYQTALEKERDHQKDIQSEAHTMENEIAVERRRGDRFDFAEGLLEAALVITSITLLTRKRTFWYFGSAVAMAGIAVAATAFTIHL